STPTRYSALMGGIQGWRSTNWSPVAVVSKFRQSATAHPAEITLNTSAIGRPFRCGHVHTVTAPSSGIKIIVVIKPTMRREAAAPTCQWRPRRGRVEFDPSAHWTTGGPNRERQLWFRRLRY